MPSYIIGGKRYTFTQRDLLWEISVPNRRRMFDFEEKKRRIYYPKGKAFLLETVYRGSTETKLLSQSEAMKMLNAHPEGIIESV